MLSFALDLYKGLSKLRFLGIEKYLDPKERLKIVFNVLAILKTHSSTKWEGIPSLPNENSECNSTT